MIALGGCHLYSTKINPHMSITYTNIFRTNEHKNVIRGNSCDDFLHVLESTRNLFSSDPRDKVFAVSSLCDSYCALSVTPDYTLSTTEVFQQVARLLIDNSTNLDVLCAVSPLPELFGDDNFSLPSWVPNWTMAGGALGSIGSSWHKYKAAGLTRPVLKKNENSRILS